MEEKKLQTKNIFDGTKYEYFNLSLIYLIIMICFVGIRIFASFGLLGFLGEFQDLVYSLVIQVGIIFGLTFLLYKKFQKRTVKQVFQDFKFVKINFKSVLCCIGIGLLIIILNIAFNSIYTFILSLFGYSPSASTITSYALPLFLLTIFTSAVLPGFCEEFANRGLLLRAFKNLGTKKIIVISGLIFGLMHLNIGQFGYAFMAGMLFAYICLATGSIIPGMIIHFMNNAVSEYLTFASVNDLFLGDFTSKIQYLLSGSGFFYTTIIIFMILITVLFLLCWLIYLLIKETRTTKLMAISNDLIEVLKDEVKEGTTKSVKINIPVNSMILKKQQTYFPSLKCKIPMYTIIFLGSVITIMTLIWSSL